MIVIVMVVAGIFLYIFVTNCFNFFYSCRTWYINSVLITLVMTWGTGVTLSVSMSSLYQRRTDFNSSYFWCRYVEKLAQNRPLMSDPLDVVKFVCKDFWDDVFMKKVRY